MIIVIIVIKIFILIIFILLTGMIVAIDCHYHPHCCDKNLCLLFLWNGPQIRIPKHMWKIRLNWNTKMPYEMYICHVPCHHRLHCCDTNLCSSLLIWADPIYSSLPGALLLRMDSFYFTLSSSKSWSWWWSSSSSKSWSWSMIIIEIMTKQLIFRQLLVGCNFVWSSSIKKTIKRSKWRPAPQKLEKVLKS